MKKNVFIPTFGNRPEPLVGRDGVLADFMEGLEHPEGHPHRATIIKGQRGTGKTAILLEIAARAEQTDYVTVFVTANEKILDDILLLLIDKSEKQLHLKKKVKSMSAGAFGFSFGFTFSDDAHQNLGFRLKLTMIADTLEKHNKGILILVDEVQANSSQMRELAVTYQHLVGEGKNIAIAIAGLPGAISNVMHDDILTFLNRAHKVDLTPLSLNDISLLYSERFAEDGKSIETETLNFAVESTLGYPYLMQLIGYYILRYSKESDAITKEIAENAVINAKRDMVDSIHITCLKPLSDKDRAFLEAMSQDKGSSRIGDIQKRMGVSSAYAQQYRIRLIEAGVILSEQKGRVEYAIPYLGEYLRGEMGTAL